MSLFRALQHARRRSWLHINAFFFFFFVAGRRGKAEEAGRQRESIKKVRKTGVVVCTEGTGKAKINVRKLSLFPFACKRNIRVSIEKKTLGNMFSWVPNDLSFRVDLSVRQGQSGGGFKSLEKNLKEPRFRNLYGLSSLSKCISKVLQKNPGYVQDENDLRWTFL